MTDLPNNQPSSERVAWGRLAYWALAVGMLSYGSQVRSLWADEFHSWHHANCGNLRELLESVRTDNHPPLSFLLEHFSIGLLGSTELALRLPSLLVGLIFLALLRRYLDLIAGFAGARLAPWMVLASSYYFVIFSEARMYALLALATLGLMSTLGGILVGHPRALSRWWLALWLVIGLHSHYYFLHELAITAIFLVTVWALHPGARKAFRTLLAPCLMGCILFVPWATYGLAAQLGGELPPGRAAGGFSALRDGFLHMFHWNASLGGSWLVYLVAWPGALMSSMAMLLGVRVLIPKIRVTGAVGMQSSMILLYGLGLPVLTWSISRFSERSTFGWRYLAGSALAVLLLACIGLAGPGMLQRLLRVGLLMSMGVVTMVNLLAGGQEDHRQLFAHILAHGRPTDAVLDKPPYDPFPRQEESSWRFYVERFKQTSNPALPQEFSYGNLEQAQQYPRVWVWFRDRYHPWIARSLRRTHDVEEQWSMGPALTLHLFSKSSAEQID